MTVELCLSRAADRPEPLTNLERRTRDAENCQQYDVEAGTVGCPNPGWLETERRREAEVLRNNTAAATHRAVN